MRFFSRPIILNDSDDSTLLEIYRQGGDLSCLGQLYQRYMALVYGVCLKYLADEEAAKDAVMGIFEELIVKTRQHEVKQFRPWLYVVARNYCLMQLRSDKKAETVSLDEFMETGDFLHHDDGEKETVIKALEKCMDKLPEKQKTSVGLFYLEEKCYKEIAETTGFSMNEVKSFIQNGKRNLKICLEKNGA